jgi:hypothetical protein
MILASLMAIPSLEAAATMSPDFSISANPTSVIVNPGPQGNSTITLTSQQGFAGKVNMTVGASPHGLYCQLAESSLNVTVNSSNSTMLYCDGNPGTFTVTVVAKAAILGTIVSHQISVNFVVTDFFLSTSPSSLSLSTGKSASTSVTIASEYPFAQNIYLNLTLPPGINGTVVPSVLSGPGISALYVNSTTAGVYNLTIVAASGLVSHKLSLIVTVTNPPPQSGRTIFGLPVVTFYVPIAAVAVIASTGLIVSFRHRTQSRKRKIES